MAMDEMSKEEMERLSAESVERAITAKLEELEDDDTTRWRKFTARNQAGPVAGHDALRELMRLMIKGMGFEFFLTTPAAILEQFALSAVARNEDIPSLLEMMLRAPLIAYGHPDTAAELIDRVTDISNLCKPIIEGHLAEEHGAGHQAELSVSTNKPILH
ncbi:hypothetical protein KO116_P200163 (plasmid) [Halomonas sp. KO116]|nr:hypothetical protein KO116_P200163 [Halomonas sp. KO116]